MAAGEEMEGRQALDEWFVYGGDSQPCLKPSSCQQHVTKCLSPPPLLSLLHLFLLSQWLNELLPDNAHELCRGRVTLIVTTMALPGGFQQVGISDFRDKKDLVEACMASAHVPIVLDLKMSRQCR